MYKIGVYLGTPQRCQLFISCPLSPPRSPQVVHQGVSRRSKDYYDMLRRYNYVTPTSYLELLQTFKVPMPLCNGALLLPTLPGIAGPRELPLMTVPLALCCVRAAHPSPCRWC